MGFFDKLKNFVNSGELDKITDAVGKTVNTILNEQAAAHSSSTNTVQTRPQTRQQTPTAPQNAAAQPVSPAKPSRKITDTFYDGDNAEITVEYSFMLSGDFVESDCGAGEVDYIAVYAPECTDDYADFENSDPIFVVMSAPESEIYDLIENYKNGASITACEITKVSLPNSKIYFKTQLAHRNQITYFYALDRGEIWKNCYIGVKYPPYVAGTPLEAKLKAAVDEAVATYTETIK